jgi:hypothetical protein
LGVKAAPPRALDREGHFTGAHRFDEPCAVLNGKLAVEIRNSLHSVPPNVASPLDRLPPKGARNKFVQEISLHFTAASA